MLAGLGLLAACARSSDEAPEAASPAGNCADGFVEAVLFGGVSARINWSGEHLTCEGMPRPDDDGARLRFAGPVEGDDERRLTIILGIPALTEGTPGRELATNVTLIEDGTGRFFATRNADSCWTDISNNQHIEDALYRVTGVLYCVAPVPELNGAMSVSFNEMRFSGALDWNPPE